MPEIRAKEARMIQTAAEGIDLHFARQLSARARRENRPLSGVITMRKRSGTNWFLVLSGAPAGPNVGPGVRERFETFTFLATPHAEAEIFETRFQFAPDVEISHGPPNPHPRRNGPTLSIESREIRRPRRPPAAR